MKNSIGNLLDACLHCIGGIYSADNCGPALVTALVLYANALNIGNYDKVLPYLLGKTALVKFVTKNCISLTKRLKSVAGDSTEATDTESGAGERLTVNHCVRKTKRLTNYSYLVLIEKLYRLNELEIEVLGKSANVVVGLNCLLALCLLNAFKYIGIDSSLRKIGKGLARQRS